jgi:hypothetical protein
MEKLGIWLLLSAISPPTKVVKPKMKKPEKATWPTQSVA